MKGTQKAIEKTSVFERMSQGDKNKLILMVATFLLSAFYAGAEITKGFSPFAIAPVAALNGKYSFMALLGCILGYGVFGVGANIRYIAAALIVSAVKWAFAAFFETEQKWAEPTVAAFVNLAVGTILIFTNESSIYDILLLLSECVILGAATYFVKELFSLGKKKGLCSAQSIVALSVCAALFLISLSKITIGMISIGRIVSAFLVLSLSFSLGSFGGAASGIAVGTALSISSADGGFAVMALSLGGMLSGLFSKTSRYSVCLIFLLCMLLSSLTSGAETQTLYFLYEALCACAMFLLMPERLFRNLVFVFPPVSEGNAYPNKYLSARLDFVSKALSETSESICEISEKIISRGRNDTDKVFSAAADKVCRRCVRKINCWNESYNETMDSFNHMVPFLRRGGRIEPENVPDRLRQRCTKLSSLINEINALYYRNQADMMAAQRAKQLREVVSQQFKGVSKLLCEMSQELSLTMCDTAAENKIGRELLREGISTSLISCPVDKFGHKSVEFYCLSQDAEKMEDGSIDECISDICNAPMQRGTILKTDELTRLCYSEAPPFKIETASFQKKSDKEEVCGDSFSCFSLENGFSAVVLSDGMGRGKSAAVDSKMTVSLISRFLSLGFSIENCVSIVNSSLMLKSDEETLSTLDAAIFDLYSGSVSIKKAGAAPSFLKRGRKVSKIEMGALPLGILGEAKVRSITMKLSKGDILVTASDGLSSLSDNEVERIIKKSENEDINSLARLLGEAALNKGDKTGGDDITVLVTKMS